MYHRVPRAVCAAMLASAISSMALAAPITNQYSSYLAFGDSLSDNGNLFAATGGTVPASPPYFNGRFSNGPVFTEALAAEFEAVGKLNQNFAFGGAKAVDDMDGIPDFGAQIFLANPVLTSGFLGADPLASIWFGANDLLAAIGGPDSIAAAGFAAQAVGANINTLSAFGLDTFLVLNLPDLSTVPNFALFQPGLAQEAQDATLAFNAALADEATALRQNGLNIIEFDTFAVFNELLADPAAFGVSDTTLPCLFPSAGIAGAFGQSQVCTPDEAAQRAFFDGVHPNATLHAALAEQTAVAAVPLPASAFFLLGGLALLGAAGVRSRRA